MVHATEFPREKVCCCWNVRAYCVGVSQLHPPPNAGRVPPICLSAYPYIRVSLSLSRFRCLGLSVPFVPQSFKCLNLSSRRLSRRTPYHCPNSLHVRVQLSDELSGAELIRAQGRSLCRVRSIRKPARTNSKRQISDGIETKRIGVVLCRSGKASIPPNYVIRVKASTKCYGSTVWIHARTDEEHPRMGKKGCRWHSKSE